MSRILRKDCPVLGLAKKSAIMFSLGRCSSTIVPSSTNCFVKKYLISICLVLDPDDPLPKNAILIVEVLSPSTEHIDQSKKFRNYRRIDTLKEYVLIEAETMSIDCYRLNEKGKWELTAYSLEETAANETDMEVHLSSVDFHCPISLLYEDVIFPRDNLEDSI